ncbi:MAG TPA: MBOAT family O-acyltransferase [Planctomycetota bacterium]
MIFTEPRFLAFFLLVFGVHWVLRTNAARKRWLAGVSLAFYGAWDWRFLFLMLVSSAIDYVSALRIEATRAPRARRGWLVLSLVSNLGILGFFKYYNFFAGSAASFLRWLGLPASDPTLAILLPVGISFYTFQALSYTIDVYRGKLAAVRSALDFLLFISFFPQLVAGPIVRATEFLPQLEQKRVFARVDVRAALTLFLIGFVKKGLVSDHVAPVIEPVFADPGAYTAASTWIALFLYHVQIYCDFSGYSDMAIATAGLLGYTLPKNFDFPFFARNISAFWQRWHISLSTWFRDYFYFALGGSKGSSLKGMLVGSLTMMVVGLWHGAGWQYLGFGVLMSGSIIVSRTWGLVVPEGSLLRRAVAFLGIPLMWWFLFWNWILFRSTGWEPAWEMQRIFFFLQPGGTRALEASWLLLVAGFFAVHYALYRGWFRRLAAVNDWVFAGVTGAAAAACLVFMATETKAFIYFQF